MLDLFCGRFGWSRAFAARGWECVGVDLVEPPEIPQGCEFWKRNVLSIDLIEIVDACRTKYFDFICASSPCEQFSVHGMKHFHPNPPYPELGIKLFNHTRELCEASAVPYVMENVRAAQQFVGNAVHHCGPFYLWGTGVPAILAQGIKKGFVMGRDPITGKRILAPGDVRSTWSGSKARLEAKSRTATIPPELASCVCTYAEALLEQKLCANQNSR